MSNFLDVPEPNWLSGKPICKPGQCTVADENKRRESRDGLKGVWVSVDNIIYQADGSRWDGNILYVRFTDGTYAKASDCVLVSDWPRIYY